MGLHPTMVLQKHDKVSAVRVEIEIQPREPYEPHKPNRSYVRDGIYINMTIIDIFSLSFDVPIIKKDIDETGLTEEQLEDLCSSYPKYQVMIDDILSFNWDYRARRYYYNVELNNYVLDDDWKTEKTLREMLGEGFFEGIRKLKEKGVERITYSFS